MKSTNRVLLLGTLAFVTSATGAARATAAPDAEVPGSEAPAREMFIDAFQGQAYQGELEDLAEVSDLTEVPAPAEEPDITEVPDMAEIDSAATDSEGKDMPALAVAPAVDAVDARAAMPVEVKPGPIRRLWGSITGLVVRDGDKNKPAAEQSQVEVSLDDSLDETLDESLDQPLASAEPTDIQPELAPAITEASIAEASIAEEVITEESIAEELALPETEAVASEAPTATTNFADVPVVQAPGNEASLASDELSSSDTPTIDAAVTDLETAAADAAAVELSEVGAETDMAADVIDAPVAVEVQPGRIKRLLGSLSGLMFRDGDHEDSAEQGADSGPAYVLDGALASPLTFDDERPKDAVLLSDSAIGLADYLRLVALNNDRIAYQRMEWAIAQSGVDSAKSMYEPALTATYRYTDSNTPNTTEEEFRRSFSPEFIEKNTDYSVGVEGMVPTGGKIKVSYSNRDLDNNIQPTPIRGEENKSYLGLSFTQPLLRGAGGRAVVEAPISVASKEQGIALQTYRLALFESISGAAVAYWDLFLAEKKLSLRQRSVEIVESVLNDERERNRFGRSSSIDVLTAQSAVAQRRVQMYSAEQEVVQSRNRLKGYVAGIADPAELQIDLQGEFDNNIDKPDRQATLANAFNNRPEYLASLLRAEKEEVRMKFASNNRLPQLDLIASYGLNGLDKSFSSSWDNLRDADHKTMYVGLEYKMFLLGNKKAKSELVAATLRKHQALLEVQAAEVTLNNSVDTAMSNLLTAILQVNELSSVTSTNARLLSVEMARFDAGQSSSRDILDLEESINETAEIALQSQANMQKAVIGVALADGTLLKQFRLER